jgi:hypothetical protein
MTGKLGILNSLRMVGWGSGELVAKENNHEIKVLKLSSSLDLLREKKGCISLLLLKQNTQDWVIYILKKDICSAYSFKG